MNIDRNLYFSDINNNIENKVFYNNEYKSTVMCETFNRICLHLLSAVATWTQEEIGRAHV